VLEAGHHVPLGATVWMRPRETATIGELVAPGPVLFLFYLFDWSST
jgi:hypothetical protein